MCSAHKTDSGSRPAKLCAAMMKSEPAAVNREAPGNSVCADLYLAPSRNVEQTGAFTDQLLTGGSRFGKIIPNRRHLVRIAYAFIQSNSYL